MATITLPRVQSRVIDDTALLRLTIGAMIVWQVGLYVDVWNHLHYGFQIESFMTWAHAILYGGWVLTSVPALLYLLEGRRRGHATLPAGYTLVLLGVALYGVGGVFDSIWHTLFGFEASHDAAMSPSHLWLAAAFTVSAFGLLQAAIRHARRGGDWLTHLQVAFVLQTLLLVAHWSISYGQPMLTDYADGGAAVRNLPAYAGLAWTNVTAEVAGTTGLLLYSALVVAFMVFALYRLRLGSGAISVMIVGEAAIISPAGGQWLFLPCAVAGALVGEALWWRIRRGGLGGPEHALPYAVLGGVVPLVQLLVYLVTLSLFGAGLIWSVHLLGGVPVAAALIGVIVALLIAPPEYLRSSVSAGPDRSPRHR
jgi:hypothetical protein